MLRGTVITKTLITAGVNTLMVMANFTVKILERAKTMSKQNNVDMADVMLNAFNTVVSNIRIKVNANKLVKQLMIAAGIIPPWYVTLMYGIVGTAIGSAAVLLSYLAFVLLG